MTIKIAERVVMPSEHDATEASSTCWSGIFAMTLCIFA